MKRFFVSKSDIAKRNKVVEFITETLPDNVYILCEKDRIAVYKGINAVIMPLYDLNKDANWITFNNTFTSNSLLVIDNVLKFIFFGDGSKKHIKDISQSINNMLVMDIVPFYSEPEEIFYPFYFLGKDILGYNNYNAFKANNLEEKDDGSIDYSHSFSVLGAKIAPYYEQDHACFFDNMTEVEFSLSLEEQFAYEETKQKESENFTNPIKLYNSCSANINLVKSRFSKVNEIVNSINGKIAVVINCLGIYPKMYSKHLDRKDVHFFSIHSNPNDLKGFDCVILAEMPIVKPHSWLYIQSALSNIIVLKLTNNKLERFFHNKIFNNELRNEIDTAFYNADLQR